MKLFTPTPHEVLVVPTAAAAMEHGRRWWEDVMARRERMIEEAKRDPYAHQWEPPIWKVCDALLGLPWVDPEYGEAMRRHLGFRRPIRVLMLNGGNRGGKSQYAASRVMRMLRMKPGAKAWCAHESLDRSREDQQPLLFNYLPPGLKLKDVKTRSTYIAYKQKTGFSENRFVLPPPPEDVHAPGSTCTFMGYGQDDDTIEGGELDVVWMDELFPPFWQRTMPLRVATRNGFILETFTPVRGYTETVGNRHDGAVVVKESIAYLVPADGGPPDVPRALGLSSEEYEEVLAADHVQMPEGGTGRRASWAPQSRPEDCDAWLRGESGQLPCPEGREFKRVPRVLKCADPEEQSAVVFFHSSDNPYGNPKQVQRLIAAGSEDFKKERFYGVATKVQGKRFARYNEKVHVVPDADIPEQGENYLIVDPASGRNLFMTWFRVTAAGSYVYREWPGSYRIPGQGIPGPWAEPDGKRADGRKGPAQSPFGWGLLEYKRELARLEGWQEFEAAVQEYGDVLRIPLDKVARWDQFGAAKEEVRDRYLDSRLASAPRLERDRPTTMLTEFLDIGLTFHPTPGGKIEGDGGGVHLIANLLAYDDTRPVSSVNQPRLKVAESCTNTRFALRTWTNADGQKGACKDPIDNIHYFAELDVDPWAPELESDFEENEELEPDTY